jgi:hypothetical protein
VGSAQEQAQAREADLVMARFFAWAKIPDFPRYYASTDGRIRSIMDRPRLPRILRPKIRKDYLTIGLRNAARKKRFMRVHRLVAMAFIPNPLALPCIDHINGDKLDNRASNLRWVTLAMNSSFHNWKPKKKRFPEAPRGINWNTKLQSWCVCIRSKISGTHTRIFTKSLDEAKSIREGYIRDLGL